MQIAPGTFIDIAPDAAEGAAETPPSDLGLYEITRNPDDRWKYRTPTLRNIALTAPYMHNGTFGDLEQVVRFYNAGGVPNPVLDPLIRPLGLSDEEIGQLVAFLRSLTGSNVAVVVADAHATPMGNIVDPDD
jgi:cytochrome c peroxidase